MPNVLPVRQPHTAGASPHRRLRSLALLVALAVLLPMGGDQVQPVAAGGTCTGWESITVPPDTIRVGRADGTVDKVDFRTYVSVVMAKEWPGWVPLEARKAGAVAVKQYGWYWTLKGNHRSSYVNSAGKCYDVRDSTADQLYKPEKVTVGDKIWKVVDATWGLSVRKGGKFFMTGYRAGNSSVCASDVDGWKLFAKSVMDCAERGWSRERIQTRYYAPDVTFHWSGGEAVAGSGLDAAIGAPKASLRAGMALAGKHTLVSWDPQGQRPEGTTYQLQRKLSGSWSNVSLKDPTQTSVALRLKWGLAHRFRVRLRDAAGNVGPWYTGPAFDAILVQDKNDRMGWSPGDWQRENVTAASASTVTYATRPGSQSALYFTGRALGVVATLGPDRGRARIYVNGKLLGEVDLYAPEHRWRVLVFTKQWAASKRRVVRIDLVDEPSRPRVDVDAILFYR